MKYIDELDIPKAKQRQLKDAGINNSQDLVSILPRKYHNLANRVDIKDLSLYEGQTVVVKGVVDTVSLKPGRVTVKIRQDGAFMLVFFFNGEYMYKQIVRDDEYIFVGKITFNHSANFAMMGNPEFFSNRPYDFNRIIPVYKKIKGMSDAYLKKCIKLAIDDIYNDPYYSDFLPDDVLKENSIPNAKQFYLRAHYPKTATDIDNTNKRKIIEIIYPFAEKMAQRHMRSSVNSKFIAENNDLMNLFIKSLPFTLTPDQDKGIKGLSQVMKTGKRLDALVQGDVGCGKTVVAIAMAANMAGNDYQTVVMVPTTVLAEQHYTQFSRYLEPLGIRVALLSTGVKKKERDVILKDIEDGKIDVVVGTHSVISDDVKFNRLALTIIDEEHRFGVEQRQKLRDKASEGIHGISMTATPIPRTLAIAMYGDTTEIVNIRTMPPGRKPVLTYARTDYEKVFEAMSRQIEQGHQCYIVCPLIDDSDSDIMEGVESVEAIYNKTKQWISDNNLNYTVEKISGNLKADTIQSRLKAFTEGKTQILISTTIVEIGVDVPNATLMIISNAERFGLAQLHQLRGRVGRGSFQSYCVMVSASGVTERIEAMLMTNDGFEIANKDMKIRGSGDLVGIAQHGDDMALSYMLQYPQLYQALYKSALVKLKTQQ